MTGCALFPLIGLAMLAAGCGDAAGGRGASGEGAGAAVEGAVPSDTPSAPDTATSAALPQDAAAQFAGTTAATHRPRAGAPPTTLRAARIVGQPGYDRIVFEFEGPSVPGYHVEYRETPVRRCGSGALVELPEAGRLVVRLEPARAHDDGGNPTVTDRTMAPALAAVRRMIMICDFEGQVTWALGVNSVTPYRVQELAQPARLTIDVRHPR